MTAASGSTFTLDPSGMMAKMSPPLRIGIGSFRGDGWVIDAWVRRFMRSGSRTRTNTKQASADVKAEHVKIMNRRIVSLPYVAMDLSKPVPGHPLNVFTVFFPVHAFTDTL